MSTTIPAKRIEWFATEMAALGCKVTDTTDSRGIRTVMVSGAHWMDRDTVFVSYSPASSKEGKGRRDSLFCMVFSDRRYPRKGSAVVEYHQAVSAATMLKDYTLHTHCEPTRHTTCTETA
jgi:hypothetical protein